MRKFLFTTLFSDDLGLLTRTLPVAIELSRRGHKVTFCNPAKTPTKLIKDAGLDNLLPRHPLFYLEMTGKPDIRGLYSIIRSGKLKKDFGNVWNFTRKYISAVPTRFPPKTSEVWNMDHFAALCGMLNPRFMRAICQALVELMADFDADVIVDSWNPCACAAARSLSKPVVTIIQADMHPSSQGFIWWKKKPPDVPTAVPSMNKIITELGIEPIKQD